jgi:hypothetical protein
MKPRLPTPAEWEAALRDARHELQSRLELLEELPPGISSKLARLDHLALVRAAIQEADSLVEALEVDDVLDAIEMLKELEGGR